MTPDERYRKYLNDPKFYNIVRSLIVWIEYYNTTSSDVEEGLKLALDIVEERKQELLNERTSNKK